jgi:hypothetical protein
MRTFPSEFSELLSARGRRVLNGSDRTIRELLNGVPPRFLALENVIDRRRAHEARGLLERALEPALFSMESPIPPETIFGMTENYSEQLPKTVRVRTALLADHRGKAARIAKEIGLTACLTSASFRTFAMAITGRNLSKRWGIQALRYGPGDYSGPHNDHHPEDVEARDGYLDVHVSLTSAAVQHQWLVYSKQSHFSQIQRVHTLGGVTAYRLPFWHYTTPLVAKPKQELDANRWVLLGTFLYN